LDKHPSLEAIVVDHADEIAYTSHDIDDGIKYGIITFDDLKEDNLCANIDEIVQKEGIKRGEPLYRHRFVAGLIKLLVEDFMEYSQNGIEQHKGLTPIVSQLDAGIPLPIGFSKPTARALKQLKKVLFKKLYRHEKIARKMYAGKQCIRGLYSAFMDDKDLLPTRQHLLCEQRNTHRVIADYIAAMTDRYAMKTYHEIYGMGL
jgi:dGTPase